MQGRMGIDGAPDGLVRLPRDEIRLEGPDCTGHVVAALHALDGVLYWTKWRLADLPNELVGVEDLKRFGIAAHRV